MKSEAGLARKTAMKLGSGLYYCIIGPTDAPRAIRDNGKKRRYAPRKCSRIDQAPMTMKPTPAISLSGIASR